MHNLEMIPLPKRAPGMRERIRQLEAQNKVLDDANKAYEQKYNQLAEDMAGLLFRLEGVRDKFDLTPEQVDSLAEAFLAKVSAQQDMQRLAAQNVKKFTVNGVDIPLRSNSTSEASPANTLEASPAEAQPHCASDGDCIASPPEGLPPPSDKPGAPVRDFGE